MIVEVPVLMKQGEPLAMRTLEVSEPTGNQVGVRMSASGVCHSCLHAADGSHKGIPLPIVLGDEGAGVVETVGPGVKHLRPGDHVIISWTLHCGRCRWCVSGRPVLCSNAAPLGKIDPGPPCFRDVRDGNPVHHYGPATYSPYLIVPETSAVPVRQDLPLEQAALLGCSVATGVGAVINSGQVRAGQSVIVFGCGGVGLNAIQGARMAGANPIVAVDLHPAKLRLAERMGATHTVDSSTAETVNSVLEITGEGADCVVVAVGNAAVMELAAEAVGPGGILVIVGAPPTGQKLSFDPSFFTGKERRIVGSKYGSINPSIDFPMLADLCMAGKLDVDTLITARYELSEANAAFYALAEGEPGRSVIVF